MATPTTILRSTDDGATWSETPLASGFDGSPITLLGQTADGHLLLGTSFGKNGPAMWVGTATQ